MVEFTNVHHQEWAEACRYGVTDLVKRYLQHGYDPDDHSAWGGRTGGTGLMAAVANGNLDVVEVLIKALKDKLLKDNPEALIYKLTYTREARNFFTKSAANFVDAVTGGSERKSLDDCVLLADKEAQAIIDTLPLERRRTFQRMFPPLKERER